MAAATSSRIRSRRGLRAVDKSPSRSAPVDAISQYARKCCVPIAVVRRIVLQPEVTIRTLLGAIAAYLLLAFSFFMIFLEIDAYEACPFFEEEVGTTDFMYFSLVTITTLGYGDFSPTTNTGQLASVAEAVIGQIFLVTLVAALVSRFAAKPRTRPDAD